MVCIDRAHILYSICLAPLAVHMAAYFSILSGSNWPKARPAELNGLSTASRIRWNRFLIPAPRRGGWCRRCLHRTSRGPPARPADIASYMFVNGLPGVTVTLLLEAKNTRAWVYPQSLDLY